MFRGLRGVGTKRSAQLKLRNREQLETQEQKELETADVDAFFYHAQSFRASLSFE